MKGIPHNWETERALLGGLLLDGAQLPEIAALLHADDFARPNHALLFAFFVEIHARTGGIDLVVLLDEYERRGGSTSDRDFGGTSYLVALPSACPSVDNLRIYAKRIKDHAVRRRLLEAYHKGIEAIEAGERTTAELVDDAGAALAAVSAVTAEERPQQSTGEIVDEWMREAEERTRTPGKFDGVETGFVDLDRMLKGLHRGEQVILAGRPAMGKTALSTCIALRAARNGVPVQLYSLEMTRKALVGRLICQEARVDSQRVRDGSLDPNDDWPRLLQAAETVHRLPIHIDDRRGLQIATLRDRARRAKREHRIGLYIVDYLTLLAWTFPKANADTNVSHNSRGLRDLWGELDAAGLVLAQINRGVESRTDKRPLPSDLRDSGSIEQDADSILFIYRDEVYHADTPDRGLAEIIVAKQRNGPIGKVKVAYLAQFTLFSNYAAGGYPEDDRKRMAGGDSGYY